MSYFDEEPIPTEAEIEALVIESVAMSMPSGTDSAKITRELGFMNDLGMDHFGISSVLAGMDLTIPMPEGIRTVGEEIDLLKERNVETVGQLIAFIMRCFEDDRKSALNDSIHVLYIDATAICHATQSLIASLEDVLQKHGLGNAPATDLEDEPIPFRPGVYIDGHQWCSALDYIVRCLRNRMKYAKSPTFDPSNVGFYFRVSEDGTTVLNEQEVLWYFLERLSEIMLPINETELFGDLFHEMCKQEPCNFETASVMMPTLILSCNKDAIQHAVNIVRSVEPVSEAVVQGEARIRQLEIDEQSLPIESLSGPQFEELLAKNFTMLGFTVKSLGGSGDFGADLLLTSVDATVIAVQAKRWKARVNLKAVQEVHGSLSYYSADFAIVVASGGFYPSAEQLAARCGVELWGKSEVLRFLQGDVAFSQIAPIASG